MRCLSSRSHCYNNIKQKYYAPVINLGYDNNMNITIAGDHYTTELIAKLKLLLEQKGFTIEDKGSKSKEDIKTLQEIIPAVTKSVNGGEAEFGILVCGTGVGVEIGANRLKGIRASLCRDAEQAKNARVYDNANVLCLGSWYNDSFEEILDSWTLNKFDGDEKRTQMLKDFDELV